MITITALIRELHILGEVTPPAGSIERVWMRVLGETGKAGVPELNPAEGRVCAARPVAPSNPGLRAGTSLPGLRPISPPDTAPASVLTAGVEGLSGVRK